jgi:hypothetical protein
MGCGRGGIFSCGVINAKIRKNLMIEISFLKS